MGVLIVDFEILPLTFAVKCQITGYASVFIQPTITAVLSASYVRVGGEFEFACISNYLKLAFAFITIAICTPHPRYLQVNAIDPTDFSVTRADAYARFFPSANVGLVRAPKKTPRAFFALQ